MSRVLLVAKSRWSPSIRREHAVSTMAGRQGINVDFIESPADIRAANPANMKRWLNGFATPLSQCDVDGLRTYRRSVPVPGHRNQLAAAIDNSLLKRALKKKIGDTERSESVVVVNLPWQWAATDGLGVRRVFDAADDWTALLGGGRAHVRAAYSRISVEADSIIVANRNLQGLFPGRAVHVVENGMPADLVASRGGTRPHRRRLIYVGTLSQRFDVELVEQALRRLPGWTLDLYGECRYPGLGDRPSGELARLLGGGDGRVRWHGVIERSLLADVLDASDVALVPNVPEHSRGQSSMKFGDYAARGMPIVSTRWEPDLISSAPPGTWFCSTAEEFAAAVNAANRAGTAEFAANVAWAATRTWDHQWPKWARAAFESSRP